jgi:cytochrome c oxidase cbb3-type subunit I/II
MLSVKSINALSHFTDWTIAHVHIGALGWNGLLTFGILYWLVPKLYNTGLYSKKLANMHFWIATLGMIFYAIPMYWAGITQGLMWKEFTAEGYLQYPLFLETVLQIVPMYHIRAFGGIVYLAGVFVMLYNLTKTIKSGSLVEEEKAQAPALREDTSHGDEKAYFHRWIERKPVQFIIATVIAVAIGGIVEIIPTFLVKSNIPTITSVKPYTPLELEGRDIYVREGCYTCHSQLIRPFRSETERYGEYSKAGEFVYDHPFQWGSKRTGPDLHRVGGKYPDAWHYNHMLEPESMSPGSLMPPYPWLISDHLNTSTTEKKIRTMQSLGVPYPEGFDKEALADLNRQAEQIALTLKDQGVEVQPDREIIALIAYLQRLGVDIKTK